MSEHAIKLAHWRETLSSFTPESSSLRSYCASRRLPYQTARYWRRQLQAGPAPAELSFAEYVIPAGPGPDAPRPLPDSGVAVECRGFLVRVAPGFDPGVLDGVLDVLAGRMD